MASRPMSSVSGRRPTATRMTSTVRSVRFEPSLVAIWKLMSASPFLSVSVSIVEATWLVMPRLRKTRDSSLPTSGSSSGTIRSANSMSVTSAPKSRYMRGPLDADRAGADDRHPPRDVAAGEGLVGGDDQPAVGVEAGKRAWRAAGGQHQVVGARLDARRTRRRSRARWWARSVFRCRAGRSPCSSSAGTRRRSRACRPPRRDACPALRSRGRCRRAPTGRTRRPAPARGAGGRPSRGAPWRGCSRGSGRCHPACRARRGRPIRPSWAARMAPT